MKDQKPPSARSNVLRGVMLQAQALSLVRARPTRTADETSATQQVDVEDAVARALQDGIAQGRAMQLEESCAEEDAALARARELARREGHAKGLEDGLREARADAERKAQLSEQERHTKLQRVNELVASAQDQVTQLRIQSEEDLVALAHEIACRVLGPSAIGADAVQDMTRQVLREHAAAPCIAAHVHPADFDELAALRLTDAHAWVADPTVDAGVVLQMARGTLDARLHHQLDSITKQLAANRAERTSRRRGGAG